MKKLSDLKIKMKIKINITKLIYFSVVSALLVIIVFILLFLFRNFYLTLNDVEAIYELQNRVAIDDINTKLSREVEEKIEQRTTKPLPNFDLIPNPFE